MFIGSSGIVIFCKLDLVRIYHNSIFREISNLVEKILNTSLSHTNVYIILTRVVPEIRPFLVSVIRFHLPDIRLADTGYPVAVYTKLKIL